MLVQNIENVTSSEESSSEENSSDQSKLVVTQFPREYLTSMESEETKPDDVVPISLDYKEPGVESSILEEVRKSNSIQLKVNKVVNEMAFMLADLLKSSNNTKEDSSDVTRHQQRSERMNRVLK